MSDPFVAIGGDAAGLSAASKCKREDPDRDSEPLDRGSRRLWDDLSDDPSACGFATPS
jgi:hypothetical protein